MTIRLMDNLKLTGIMLAVLVVAAACSSGDSSKPDSEASGNAVATSAPIVAIAPSSDTTGSGDTAVMADPVAASDTSAGTSKVVMTSEAAVEQATGILFLEMLSPSTDELFVTESSYEFTGRTTVDALLSVNDSVLEVDEEGRFAFAMDLEEGPNIIEVVASNALGEQFDQVLLVIYEPA